MCESHRRRLCSPSGDPIPVRCTQGESFDVRSEYTGYGFDKKLPDNTVMRVLVATPKAVKVVPFTLKNVALP